VHCRLVWIAALMVAGASVPALAQGRGRVFAGGMFGVSTLSADGRSIVTMASADVSLYKPENGPVVDLFAGLHLHRYFSVQANYVWNHNDLTLVSSVTSPRGGGYYEQGRSSTQHAVVAEALLYFRSLERGIRPYLSTGLAVTRFDSEPMGRAIVNGVSPPPGRLDSTRIGLRVAVGIDIVMTRAWSFRYSFSERISGNPISPHLMPAGERRLANFKNLFGVVRRF
jgi:hypothetical protein